VRLLIVEDDRRLRERLAAHFRAASFVVDEAPDAREADWFAAEYPCDVAIVDLGLPDRPGMELIRDWRGAGLAMPVLILTARADWQDKVGGLEAGADDYVTKPFYLEEVEARVRALLRRVEGRRSAVADYGALRIDFSARRVFRDGEELALTSYEFNTLAYLVHRGGEVISRLELLDHLYDGDSERDGNVIEQFVARLRRKLDPAGTLRPIETVRGAGYRFTLERASA
jgi:two-component system response regulator PhoP